MMMGDKKITGAPTWQSTFNGQPVYGEPGTYLPMKIQGKDYEVNELVPENKTQKGFVNYGKGTGTTGTAYTYGQGDEWWGEGGYSTGYTYKSACHHWRVPVEVKGVKGTLLASGHQNRPKGNAKEWGRYPDLGVYLSNYWLEDLGGIASVGLPDLIVPLWPFITITWPDYGTVNQTYYKKLVETAVTFLRAGKTVEIACAAGHGRTGTMLAGIIATVEGTDAATSLKNLRTRYCKEAVESYGQEVMLYTFLGEEAPPNTYKTSYSYGSKLCTCGHTDGMHGRNINDPLDYKIGVCVSNNCECQKFVDADAKKEAKQKGALKPCSCGHAKNKHRGYDKTCVKCKECTGYMLAEEKPKVIHIPHSDLKAGQIPLPQATVEPAVCVCGHLKSTHWQKIGYVACKLCMCEEYIDSDTVEDADLLAYSFPGRWEKVEGKGMVHRDTGETWQEHAARVTSEEMGRAKEDVPSKATVSQIVDRLIADMDGGVIPD